jgi:hypothetical protein
MSLHRRWTRCAGIARVLALATGLGGLFACGGTSGHEDIPTTPPASSGGDDATVEPEVDSGSADATTVDVTLQYANPARLNNVVSLPPAVNPDAGSDAAYLNWPNYCSCDDPNSGNVDDAGMCGTYVWINPACDNCIRNIAGCAYGYSGSFPPCCGLAEAGLVGPGSPAMGEGQFVACGNLWDCVMDNANVWVNSGVPEDLFCGDAGASCSVVTSGPGAANGPCLSEVQSAYETQDPAAILTSWSNFLLPGSPGAEGHQIIALLPCVLHNCKDECFPADAGN